MIWCTSVLTGVVVPRQRLPGKHDKKESCEVVLRKDVLVHLVQAMQPLTTSATMCGVIAAHGHEYISGFVTLDAVQAGLLQAGIPCNNWPQIRTRISRWFLEPPGTQDPNEAQDEDEEEDHDSQDEDINQHVPRRVAASQRVQSRKALLESRAYWRNKAFALRQEVAPVERGIERRTFEGKTWARTKVFQRTGGGMGVGLIAILCYLPSASLVIALKVDCSRWRESDSGFPFCIARCHEIAERLPQKSCEQSWHACSHDMPHAHASCAIMYV